MGDEIGPQERIRQAESKLEEVKAAYEAKVEQARKDSEEAKQRYESRIEQCKQAVADASAPYDGLVMEVGPVKLYGDRIEYENNLLKLDDRIEITVSTSGNVYSDTKISGGGPSIGGALVGGVIAGEAGAIVGGTKKITSSTETHDARGVFLTAVSDAGSLVAPIDPQHELDARNLTAKAKYLIRTLEKRESEVEGPVSDAKEKLDEAMRDTAEANELSQRYEQIKSDTSEVDAAKAEYESVVSSIDPSEIRAEKLAKVKRHFSRAMQVVKILLALFFIALGLEYWLDYPQSAVGGIVSLLLADALIVSTVHRARARKVMQ